MYQSDYINKVFQNKVSLILHPVLEQLGFEQYRLDKGWSYPTFLWYCQDKELWFGTSYDWKDNYHVARLGSLYLYNDVLPTVTVLGINLDNSIKYKSKFKIDQYIESLLLYIKETLTTLLSTLIDTQTKISEEENIMGGYYQEKIVRVGQVPLYKL